MAHPGWGEALFCKDIWPDARLLVFSEFYYRPGGATTISTPSFTATTGRGAPPCA